MTAYKIFEQHLDANIGLKYCELPPPSLRCPGVISTVSDLSYKPVANPRLGRIGGAQLLLGVAVRRWSAELSVGRMGSKYGAGNSTFSSLYDFSMCPM